MFDSFYTPAHLAEQLISAVFVSGPTRIIDFSAGNGSLLKAAAARWPCAEIYGMDIDPNAIRELSNNLPKATLFHADFLQITEKMNGNDCATKYGNFDIVVLNPPFSVLGKRKFFTNVGGDLIKGSVALTFVARALNFLEENGELVAILPKSCFSSERDTELRNAISKNWRMQLIGESRSNEFSHCSVTVDLVRIFRKKCQKIQKQKKNSPDPIVPRGKLFLMRGNISNNSLFSSAGLPFVHSTELVNGKINRSGKYYQSKGRVVNGKAVLLPRVGRPNINKVVIKYSEDPIVISDCVISIQSSNNILNEGLYEFILEKCDILSKLYNGTCASYLTKNNLTIFFNDFGYEVQWISYA